MVVHMINEQLNTVNMMLKSTTCDNTGERYWTVVSFTAATVDKYLTKIPSRKSFKFVSININ